MTALKLVAFDEADLNVIAVHLQDAVVRVGDMMFLPAERRFAAVLNRFDWAAAAASGTKEKGKMLRRRTGIRFEHVEQASVQGVPQHDKDHVLALLTIGFEAVKPPEPEGHILLVFSGGATVRLKVEAIELELRDLDAAWGTRHEPKHDRETAVATPTGKPPAPASRKG